MAILLSGDKQLSGDVINCILKGEEGMQGYWFWREGDLESDVTSPFFRLGHETYCVVSVRIQRCPEEVSGAHWLSGEDMEHLAQDSTLEHGETRRRPRYSVPMPDFCCVNNCFHEWGSWCGQKDPGKWPAFLSSMLPGFHRKQISILQNFKTEHIEQMTQLPLNFLQKYCTSKQKTYK